MSGDRMILWWTDRYTRGLPAEVRSERIDEIRSDVWEHRRAFGATRSTLFAALSRCLRGVPADLTWRRSQRARGRHVSPSLACALRGGGWFLALASYLVLLGMYAYNATALVGLDLYGADWEEGDVARTASLSGALLVLLATGGLSLHSLPRIGATLLAVGALGSSALAFPCLVPLLGPLGLAVGIGGAVLARRRRRAARQPIC